MDDLETTAPPPLSSPHLLLDSFPRATILLVGDVMLDEYIWGDVRRISPEAPVPVVEVITRSHVPGGAANVANNIAHLGAQVHVGGVVGADDAAARLRGLLSAVAINVEGLLTDATRPTTSKLRIVAHSQQLARVDSEQRHALTQAQENALVEWAARLMPTVGACILSDYSKGVLSPTLIRRLIDLARAFHKPVIVDPKGSDYSRYLGATVITPNVHEAERATNIDIHSEDDARRVGRALLELLPGSALLLTRGAAGMSVFQNGHPPAHIPTVGQSVYDVTGAGDTVISALALAIAAGAQLEQAARLANLAASIVVGKLGTAPVTREELRHALDVSASAPLPSEGPK